MPRVIHDAREEYDGNPQGWPYDDPEFEPEDFIDEEPDALDYAGPDNTAGSHQDWDID